MATISVSWQIEKVQLEGEQVALSYEVSCCAGRQSVTLKGQIAIDADTAESLPDSLTKAQAASVVGGDVIEGIEKRVLSNAGVKPAETTEADHP